MTDSKYETLPQVAKRWGVTRARVHQMVQQGQLEATRIGRDWVVRGEPERPARRKSQYNIACSTLTDQGV